MIKTCAGLVVLLVLATTAQAGFAPLTSPMPKLRSGIPAANYSTPHALKTSLIPRLRSSRGATGNSREITTLMQIAELERQEQGFRRAATQTQHPVDTATVALSLIPRLRPKGLGEVRVVAKTAVPQIFKRPKKRRQSRKGSVCGVRSIKGTAAPRISGRGGCGIANPVKVTEVAGIPFTRELVVNCRTAKKLEKWVARSVKPMIGRKGGGLAAIQIIGGYSCRTRNSKRGAKLSEHATGNAIDIAGFKLHDGTIYSVKRNWRGGGGSRTLRRIHKSACGPFGTVLGPNADRHHKDHFHLDTARRRSGAYCR